MLRPADVAAARIEGLREGFAWNAMLRPADVIAARIDGLREGAKMVNDAKHRLLCGLVEFDSEHFDAAVAVRIAELQALAETKRKGEGR